MDESDSSIINQAVSLKSLVILTLAKCDRLNKLTRHNYKTWLHVIHILQCQPVSDCQTEKQTDMWTNQQTDRQKNKHIIECNVRQSLKQSNTQTK